MKEDVDVSRWLDEEFPLLVPTGLLVRVLEATSKTRPRRRWFARLSGHHLSVSPPPRMSPRRKDRWMNRRVPLVVGLAAIVLAAAFGLSRLAPPEQGVVGASAPLPSPTTPAPSAAPESALGPLAAGTYTSVSFQPALQFTVPAGWEKEADDLFGLVLHGPDGGPTGVYCPDPGPNWGESCRHHDNLIAVAADRALGFDARDCEGLAKPGSPGSVDGMVAALLADPRFDVNVRGRVTVGGLHGQRLFISLVKSWTGTCKWSDGKPSALFLTAAHPPGPFVGLGPWEELDVTLLDSPSGILSILIDSSYRRSALEVVNTFIFER